MSEELKPCPFCGIKKKIEICEDDMFYVECLRCGTRTDFYLFEAEAITAWNTRQPDTELVDAIRKYGKHTRDCNLESAFSRAKGCNCELGKILTKYKGN